MNPSEPSLFQLFRRSRYLRLTDPNDPDGQVKMRQAERFAAAAVGFCLKYSGCFRKAFLARICGLGVAVAERSQPTIEVEPIHWADLRVILRDGLHPRIWVIEFKIDARIDPKQNPSIEKEFCSDEGYGAKLQAFNPGPKNNYIVICRPSHLTGNGLFCQAGIRWKALEWRDVGHCCVESDSLAADLLHSLARLGVTEFFMHEIKSTTVGGFGDATEAVKVVQGLRACQEFTGGVWQQDIMSPAAGHLNVGVYLKYPDGRQKPPPEASLTRLLRKSLDCPGKEIAWFGYESGEAVPDRFSVSVWLYCRSSELAKKIEKRIHAALDSQEARIDERCIEHGATALVIRRGSASRLPDVEWFINVAKAAAGSHI
jgi:hypothetical protein